MSEATESYDAKTDGLRMCLEIEGPVSIVLHFNTGSTVDEATAFLRRTAEWLTDNWGQVLAPYSKPGGMGEAGLRRVTLRVETDSSPF